MHVRLEAVLNAPRSIEVLGNVPADAVLHKKLTTWMVGFEVADVENQAFENDKLFPLKNPLFELSA